MPVLDALDDLDAGAVRRWIAACVRTLEEHRTAIDGINVFPVPDRDTGTNLLRTMRACEDAVARITGGRAEVWAAVASGALAGARGNSGVILSQLLRGLAEVFGPDPDADPRAALRRADELAAKAVSDPAPGTMLTVLHAVARAVAGTDGSLADVTAVAATEAARALAATQRELDVLARAGVVDAGAQGLALVLDELAAVVAGRPNSDPPPVTARTPRDADMLEISREAGSTEYAYEVMYALEGVDERAADDLRTVLRGLGDCVSVAGDGTGRWTVHVHCNDIGAAIECGVERGSPRRITVVRFDDQVPATPTRFARERAVVALSRGAGIADLFRAEGATVLTVRDGEPPDPSELGAVLAGTQAAQVTLLPNEPDLGDLLTQVRDQAAEIGVELTVVQSASPVQGLAALAVHDPTRRAVDDVVAMAEAAAATRRGELTVAEGEGITWVGRCRPGDVLGLLDGEVVLIEPGPPTEDAILAGAERLLERMLSGGGELVTVLPGAGVEDGVVEALTDFARAEHREVELTCYPGGQTDSILLIGVE